MSASSIGEHGALSKGGMRAARVGGNEMTNSGHEDGRQDSNQQQTSHSSSERDTNDSTSRQGLLRIVGGDDLLVQNCSSVYTSSMRTRGVRYRGSRFRVNIKEDIKAKSEVEPGGRPETSVLAEFVFVESQFASTTARAAQTTRTAT